MSNFPSNIDDNSTLPIVDNNIAENGADVINSLRDAVLAIEENIGTNAQGSSSDIKSRINISLNADGTIKTSAIQQAGAFLTGPIYDSNIASKNAPSYNGINENKLNLAYSTTTLRSNILELGLQTNSNTVWINTNGAQVASHLVGVDTYSKHTLEHGVNVSNDENNSYKTAWELPIINSSIINPNLNDLLLSINTCYNQHQKASGGNNVGQPLIRLSNNKAIPNTYAHDASGIYIDTSNMHTFTEVSSVEDALIVIDTMYNSSTMVNSYSSGITSKTRNINFQSQRIIIVNGSSTTSVNNGTVGISSTLFTSNISVGDSIIISNSTHSVNNGVFIISNITLPIIQYVNQSAIPESGLVNWTISKANSSYNWNDVIVNSISCETYLNIIPTLDDQIIGDDVFKITISDNNISKGLELGNVKIGDVAVINYTTTSNGLTSPPIQISSYITGIRKDNNNYYFRISAKNLAQTISSQTLTISATVFIVKPQYSLDKSGVLNISPVNHVSSVIPSLIIANPSSAFALGQDFNIYMFDNTHYKLYIAFYPYYNNKTIYKIIAIDVTGNNGATPGLYNIDNIVDNINLSCRKNNYRLVAFKYNGNVGIMIADSYQGASFSILGGYVDTNGVWNSTSSTTNLPNNVIDLFSSDTIEYIDPFGFGPNRANIISPHPSWNPANQSAAYNVPTKLFTPHKRNFYHVNGKDLEVLYASKDEEVLESSVGYGSYFNNVQIKSQTYVDNIRLETVYRIYADLSLTNIKVGKTIVVLPTTIDADYDFNYGRFVITNISQPSCTTPVFYDVKVYDAKCLYNGSTILPTPNLPILSDATAVRIYFNDDSLGFDLEPLIDTTNTITSDNYYEVHINDTGKTISNFRLRKFINGTLVGNQYTQQINNVNIFSTRDADKINIVNVSPKLLGYQRTSNSGSINNIITLYINTYDVNTGIYSAYLCKYDGTVYTKKGPEIYGKIGTITRLYDDTYIDYIDVMFDILMIITNAIHLPIDIQLFKSLQLNDELLFLGSFSYNNVSNKIIKCNDYRNFGLISLEDLNNKVIEYISNYDRLTRTNGIIRGFDIDSDVGNTAIQIRIKGGTAVINGKVIIMNDQIIQPKNVIKNGNKLWYWVCVNESAEIQMIPMNTTSGIITVSFNITTFQTYAYSALDILERKDIVPLYLYKGTV